MRTILFRRAHFDAKDKFICFTYWGKVDHNGNTSDEVFTSPSFVSNSYKTIDDQFTGLTDKNRNKIFEGDIDSRGRLVMWNENLNLNCLHEENRGRYIICFYPFSKRDALEIEITGNVHDQN